MRPQILEIENFRNITSARIELNKRMIFLLGDNAQGKTNVLEALAYTLTLRPLRSARTSDLVQHQAEQARIIVQLKGPSRLPWQVEIQLAKSGRRVVVNGKNLRDPATLLGAVAVVSFVPDDLDLVKSGPEGRRRNLDRFVFQVQASHLSHVRDYARALRSRNLLLRDAKVDAESLQAFSETLVRSGARLMAGRQQGIELLDPVLRERHAELAPAGGELAMRYKPSVSFAADAGLAEIESALRQALKDSERADRLRKQTCRGPHLDDIALLLDGTRSRGFASQGQARSIVLAWRLAEVDLLAGIRGQGPLLLADDVLAELDDHRGKALIDSLDSSGAFVIATGTRLPASLQGRDDLQEIMIKNGVVSSR